MTRTRTGRLPALALAVVMLAAFPASADAQLGDMLKRKAQEAAKKKLEEQGAKEKAAEPAATTTATGNESGTSAVPSGTVGEGAWVNYDFKPGDRALFVEDFRSDEVGNFPRRLELTRGNMEVAEWKGLRLLRGTTNESIFEIQLKEELPERFTLEFDLKFGMLNLHNYQVYFFAPAPNGYDNNDQVHHRVVIRPSGHRISAGIEKGHSNANLTDIQTVGMQAQLIPVRIMADGSYAKMYLGSTRVANIPRANLGRSNSIRIEMACSTEEPCFVGNIRVMAGGKKIYDALASTGRVSTQGILFTTGSDEIRPESTPTLKEIGQMLSEHPDLKLTIEGHTDNVGDAATNLSLSEQRAAAVKQYLVSKHGIDASRLTFKGLGASKPTSPNTTPEARQQNRRVELVKVP